MPIFNTIGLVYPNELRASDGGESLPSSPTTMFDAEAEGSHYYAGIVSRINGAYRVPPRPDLGSYPPGLANIVRLSFNDFFSGGEIDPLLDLGSGLPKARVVGAELFVSAVAQSSDVVCRARFWNELSAPYGFITTQNSQHTAMREARLRSVIATNANAVTADFADATMVLGGPRDRWDRIVVRTGNAYEDIGNFEWDPRDLAGGGPWASGGGGGYFVPEVMFVNLGDFDSKVWIDYVALRLTYKLDADVVRIRTTGTQASTVLRGIHAAAAVMMTGAMAVGANTLGGIRVIEAQAATTSRTAVGISRVVGGTTYVYQFADLATTGDVTVQLGRSKFLEIECATTCDMSATMQAQRDTEVSFAFSAEVFTSEDDFYRIPEPGTAVLRTTATVTCALERHGLAEVSAETTGTVSVALLRYGSILADATGTCGFSPVALAVRPYGEVVGLDTTSSISAVLLRVGVVAAVFETTSSVAVLELSRTSNNPVPDGQRFPVPAHDATFIVPAHDATFEVT